MFLPPLTSDPVSRSTKRPRNWPVNAEDEDDPAKNPSTTKPDMPDKGRRVVSCKECRRLKLKCDRLFPCHSCRKRGCSDICPGALIPGRGNRFILANTGQLHERIAQLLDRIRQLEDGLGAMQSNVSTTTHPLLSADLLNIKLPSDLYGGIPPAPSAIRTSPTSNNRDIGQSDLLSPVREAHCGLHDPSFILFDPPTFNFETSTFTVPPDVMQLSSSFPFPWRVNVGMREKIRGSLPRQDEAEYICKQACSNALWQYNLDASETFIENLIHHVYKSPLEALSPRRLALLLMILSIGSLMDLNRPIGSLYGEAYHHLARASICEIPLMEEPDFDVIHALFFMLWYHLIFSNNSKAVGYAWNLMGFIAKLAQGLGLHRGGSGIKLIPEEYEKRSLVFWELMNLDCRMSLSLGRPPSLSLRHVDIKPPSYNLEGLYVPREEVVYHEWKNRFFIHCLTPILETMITTTPPPYSHFLELDAAVRNFSIPQLDDGRDAQSMRCFLNMQQALFSTARDIALLQLHRGHFTEAMNDPGHFDFDHKYAPSVLATYMGAASLIDAVEKLYETEPQLSVRFLMFWFNSYSAAAVLSLFVCRAPSNGLAAIALRDLDRGCALFRKAALLLPFSAKCIPVMERLRARSIKARNASMNIADLLINSNIGGAAGRGGDTQPKCFAGAHPALIQTLFAVPRTARACDDQALAGDRVPHDVPYLPDIYRFNGNGLGMADGRPTPFISSLPRVDGNEEFNFDHGALTVEMEETSFMAWF